MIELLSIFQWWKDEYLVWDPVKYPGINYISFRSDEIWTPDFKLLDSAIGSDPLDSLFIRVQNDGRVFQLLNADLLVNADLDLTNYPFDSQSCILQFGSYFYRTDEVEILKRKFHLDYSLYLVSLLIFFISIVDYIIQRRDSSVAHGIKVLNGL